jgi:RNA polymerase sigma-70 factor (ECF subfamily)
MRLSPEDREDLCAEVFLTIIKDDFALLRHFRGHCSLATYLAVVARRVIVRNLLQRQVTANLGEAAIQHAAVAHSNGSHREGEARVSNREEVERMLQDLDGDEARIVRMYHLEGKSYREISTAVGIAENSVGPTLSRVREKMRRTSGDRA